MNNVKLSILTCFNLKNKTHNVYNTVYLNVERKILTNNIISLIAESWLSTRNGIYQR